MSLPYFQSDSKNMSMLQTTWATLLNPVINNVWVQGTLLTNVQLTTGANVVNHKLGKKLQGWVVARKRGMADIYDTQDTNSMPALTLDLVSDSNVSVDLYVF